MTIELDGASLQEGAMDGLKLLEVYVGAEKIWPTGPRTVTITTASSQGGFVKSATGDTDLIGGWPSDMFMGQGVSFVAPVTCTRPVTAVSTFQGINAGSTIPAGTGVIPSGYAPAGTAFVFTEVL